MEILNYGLFWRRDEVVWTPGTGNKFELLGRRGATRNTLKVADFQFQQGIYILYGPYGPYYVGLANAESEFRGLGKRLKEHTYDEHKDNWDRFSWFGFKKVCSTKANKEGIINVQTNIAKVKQGDTNDSIKDVEALLIRAMGCSANLLEMKFTVDERWEQVTLDKREYYVNKLK